ncbi:hypothetical protein FB451DRAFT_1442767 [Mycena latifolia]|nr:hypothetical protein FB451DRAFT_1442767 [Mycena latifolia]
MNSKKIKSYSTRDRLRSLIADFDVAEHTEQQLSNPYGDAVFQTSEFESQLVPQLVPQLDPNSAKLGPELWLKLGHMPSHASGIVIDADRYGFLVTSPDESSSESLTISGTGGGGVRPSVERPTITESMFASRNAHSLTRIMLAPFHQVCSGPRFVWFQHSAVFDSLRNKEPRPTSLSYIHFVPALLVWGGTAECSLFTGTPALEPSEVRPLALPKAQAGHPPWLPHQRVRQKLLRRRKLQAMPGQLAVVADIVPPARGEQEDVVVDVWEVRERADRPGDVVHLFAELVNHQCAIHGLGEETEAIPVFPVRAPRVGEHGVVVPVFVDPGGCQWGRPVIVEVLDDMRAGGRGWNSTNIGPLPRDLRSYMEGVSFNRVGGRQPPWSEIDRGGQRPFLPPPPCYSSDNNCLEPSGGAMSGLSRRSRLILPVHGPTESLAREVADIIRAQRRNMAKLTGADREKVRGPIQEALIKFSRESEIGFLLAHSLATSKPVFDEAPMTRLYPRSPWFALREPNAALGFLAARAEYAALAETPPTSPDTFKYLICRAGVAYAGLCHMLALVGAKIVPSVATVCVTAEEPPLVAFGTTIGEKRGSAAKERIRSARDHDIRRANPDTVFGIEVMAWFDELGANSDSNRVAPQVRTALAAGVEVYTVSFSLDKLKIVDVLEAPDSRFHDAVRQARGYKAVWEGGQDCRSRADHTVNRTLRSVSHKQRFDRELVDNVGAARACGVNRAEDNALCARSSVHRSSKTTGRETATGGKNVWRIPPGTGLSVRNSIPGRLHACGVAQRSCIGSGNNTHQVAWDLRFK